MIHICGVQFAPELGRKADNTSGAVEEIAAATAEGAQLVVLPEATLTGYVFESRKEALEAAIRPDGPEVAGLSKACRGAGAWVVCGAIEKDGGVLYNAAYLLGPDGLVGRYRKTHTLCLGVDRFTSPGDDPFQVFELPFGKIGMHICYDGSFPETSRVLRLLGAQLLLLPTNWPELRLKRELVQVRAWENHAFFLAVNRVGTERGVLFEGGSCAADPLGRLVMSAGDAAGRFHFEVDLADADPSRVVIRPEEYEIDYVSDRRPELYAPLIAPTLDIPRTGSQRSGEPV